MESPGLRLAGFLVSPWRSHRRRATLFFTGPDRRQRSNFHGIMLFRRPGFLLTSNCPADGPGLADLPSWSANLGVRGRCSAFLPSRSWLNIACGSLLAEIRELHSDLVLPSRHPSETGQASSKHAKRGRFRDGG